MDARFWKSLAPALLVLASIGGCDAEKPMEVPSKNGTKQQAETRIEKATFGGGCFWCVEAVFQTLPGVKRVVSGYAGGETRNPTYKEVCSGKTGHAEVVQITYDPTMVPYQKLLKLFWKAHDPTTLNRQGADVGTQYRSIILHHDETQRAAAEKSKREAAGRFADPIVTEIAPLKEFYPAEEPHQNFYRNNTFHPYCRAVIAPKLEKLDKDTSHRE